MRAVFDTNVYVSAFVGPGSQGERALLLARRRRCELHTSVAILTELANKLRDEFGEPDEDVRAALKLVSGAARIAKPGRKLKVLADEFDNRILECAVWPSLLRGGATPPSSSRRRQFATNFWVGTLGGRTA